MKLSKLAHLEVEKLEKEKCDLEGERDKITSILNDEQKFNQCLINGWNETSRKYGDARRTKILNISKDDEEPTEIRSLQVSITNKDNIFVTEVSSLYTQRRGGVGTKLKMAEGEYITFTSPVETNEEVLFFTQAGNCYHCSAASLPVGEKNWVGTYIGLKDWEHIRAITSLNKKTTAPYILFLTKGGIVKKSEIEEYNFKRSGSLKALELDAGDEIVDIIFTSTDRIGILTETGNFLMIETEDIRPIGRTARGVRAIKLNDGDNVIAAHAIPDSTREIASIASTGLFKKTPITEFAAQGKNTKGSKLQKITDDEWMADFLPISEDGDILIVSSRSCIKLTTNDIPVFSKGAYGNKSIKLSDKDSVLKLVKY